MRVEFSKMHGLGNDFVVIDRVTQQVPLTTEVIRRLADRHFGIGFDQLLVVEPPTRPEVDFAYRIFNADGSEVAQCGNGVRCFARFVHDRRLTRHNPIRVETSSGLVEVTLSKTEAGEPLARVNMGQPQLQVDKVPFVPRPVMSQTVGLGSSGQGPCYAIELNGQTVLFDVVSMGNPHAVIRVDDAQAAPVCEVGPLIEAHPQFPDRVNVGFLQILDRSHVRLRVFERGVGETLACGTGACAAVVSGIQQGWLDQTVDVRLPGGHLQISWRPGEAVWMTGPATQVYEGSFDLNAFATDDSGFDSGL